MEKFEISGFGTVVEHVGPYGKGVAAVKAAGLEVMIAEQLAAARINAGPKHSVSVAGSWTGNDFVYWPDGFIAVTLPPYGPVLNNAGGAIKAHHSGKEFYPDKKFADELRQRAVRDPAAARDRGVLALPRSEVRSVVPVGELAQYSLTVFLFGDVASRYGSFLQENNIGSVPVFVIGADYAKRQDQNFGCALLVHDLSGRSGLDGGYSDLHSDSGRVRGVNMPF